MPISMPCKKKVKPSITRIVPTTKEEKISGESGVMLKCRANTKIGIGNKPIDDGNYLFTKEEYEEAKKQGSENFTTITADDVDNDKASKELKEAIKPKLTTLRSIEAAIHNKEIEKKAKLTEDEIVGVLKSAQKVRLAEKEALVNAGRDTKKLDVQLEIIESLLPAQMSYDEVVAKVKEIIANAEVKDRKLIGIAQKELKGKADGKLITQIVNEELNK